MIRKYRRTPTTCEATRWTGGNYDEIRDWAWDGKRSLVALMDDDPPTLMVYITVEDQWVRVPPGAWLVRGLAGEFYPIADEVFRRSWEALEEEQ